WLWRIALNLCYDELRRRQRREERPLDDPNEKTICILETSAGPEAAPDKSLLDQERAELVRRALDSLSETHRTVLVLRHYEDLKFREIAGVLDLPEGTVKSRMAEALTQMAGLLRTSLADKPAKTLRSHDEPRESLVL